MWTRTVLFVAPLLTGGVIRHSHVAAPFIPVRIPPHVLTSARRILGLQSMIIHPLRRAHDALRIFRGFIREVAGAGVLLKGHNGDTCLYTMHKPPIDSGRCNHNGEQDIKQLRHLGPQEEKFSHRASSPFP